MKRFSTFIYFCVQQNVRFPIELPVNLGSLISLMQVEKLHWALLSVLLLFLQEEVGEKGETKEGDALNLPKNP